MLKGARTNKEYMDYTSSYSHVKYTYKRNLHRLENCALLGYYAASSGNFYQEIITTRWTVHLLRGRSLTSRILHWLISYRYGTKSNFVSSRNC